MRARPDPYGLGLTGPEPCHDNSIKFNPHSSRRTSRITSPLQDELRHRVPFVASALTHGALAPWCSCALVLLVLLVPQTLGVDVRGIREFSMADTPRRSVRWRRRSILTPTASIRALHPSVRLSIWPKRTSGVPGMRGAPGQKAIAVGGGRPALPTRTPPHRAPAPPAAPGRTPAPPVLPSPTPPPPTWPSRLPRPSACSSPSSPPSSRGATRVRTPPSWSTGSLGVSTSVPPGRPWRPSGRPRPTSTQETGPARRPSGSPGEPGSRSGPLLAPCGWPTRWGTTPASMPPSAQASSPTRGPARWPGC